MFFLYLDSSTFVPTAKSAHVNIRKAKSTAVRKSSEPLLLPLALALYKTMFKSRGQNEDPKFQKKQLQKCTRARKQAILTLLSVKLIIDVLIVFQEWIHLLTKELFTPMEHNTLAAK